MGLPWGPHGPWVPNPRGRTKKAKSTHRLDLTQCQAGTQPLYRHPTTIQKSNHYTEIQLLYRNPNTIQKSNHYTDIQPLYRHPTTTQKANRYVRASDHYTESQPLRRNPTTIQKSSHYTSIQPLYRHPAPIPPFGVNWLLFPL